MESAYDFSCSDDFNDTELLSWLDENSSRLLEVKSTLVGEIHKFSDEQIHYPGYTSFVRDPHAVDEDFPFYYDMHIIANDLCKTGKGYVSIFFKPHFLTSPFVLSCVVCAIDSSNRERYHRSYLRFVLINKRRHSEVIMMDNFISRETLLKESDELLPNDCLKLQIECTLLLSSRLSVVTPFEDYNYEDWESSFKAISGKRVLLLDSKVGKVLRETSEWFQAVDRHEMLEKKQHYVTIPDQDIYTLFLIYKIIKRIGFIMINIQDICKMLLLADYYTIGIILDFCRIILKCFLCSEIAEVREMAENKLSELTRKDSEGRVLEKLINSFRETFSENEPLHREYSYDNNHYAESYRIEINGCIYLCDVSTITQNVSLTLLKTVAFEVSKIEEFDFYH